jgi:hypothetical protein
LATSSGAGVAFGNQTNSPQSRLTRRHIFADNLTWQHGTHRFKFGAEIELLKGTGTYVLDHEHGWREIHPVTSIVELP